MMAKKKNIVSDEELEIELQKPLDNYKKLENEEFNYNDYIEIDEEKERFRCKICKREFINQGGIHSHIKKHDPKILQCPVCGARLKNQYDYNQHVKKHKSKLMYKCEHCLQKFASVDELQMHLHSHMVNNLTKRSDWDVCKNPGHLKKGFTCNHCKTEFIDRKDLYYHIVALENLVPECPTDAFHLEINDKLENKYYAVCQICGKKFFDIRGHVEKYHRMDFKKYLRLFKLKDMTKIDTMNPKKASPKTRVWFNIHPDEDEELDIRKCRKKMNSFELKVKELLPDNVLFSDTKFYAVVHDNGHMAHRNPDFIVVPPDKVEEYKKDISANEFGYINDSKLYAGITKVIECFGDYWHSYKFTGMSKEDHEQHVKDLYLAVGISCLVIWEEELNDIDALKMKIDNFLNTGLNPCSATENVQRCVEARIKSLDENQEEDKAC